MTGKAPGVQYHYLSENSRKLVESSDSERIEYVKVAKWIDYSAAKEVLEELENLITGPRELRPQCRLIVGKSNNGKSSIIQRFLKRHPSDSNIGGESVIVPVVAVTALRADEKSLYDSILTTLFESFNPKLSVSDTQKLVIHTLIRVAPRLIIIDEVHELSKGSNRSAIACQSAIKALTTTTQIPIAAFGTHEAVNAFGLDEQMENRFEPIYLPPWKWDDDFRGLLVAFEKLLPLRRESGLKRTAIGREILDRTGGLLGEVRKLLIDSAIYAIKNNVEQITLHVIKNCKYRPVNQRRTKPL